MILASVLTAALASACGPAGPPPTPAHPPRITARQVLGLLGYPDTARLVILHADDIAITPGVTRRTMQALLGQSISSASVIATSPFIDSLPAELPRDGEPLDLGAHLTLTSESVSMRWRPAADRARVGSLVDSSGYFPLRLPARFVASELEEELAAQVERVRGAGVRPTHLDAHQGLLLYGGPERFLALRHVAKRECLPIPVPEAYFAQYPYLAAALDDGQLPLADLVSISPAVPHEEWAEFYDGAFAQMGPGVTLLLVHVGEDTPAERARFRDHAEWDAAWRARDASVVDRGALRMMARRHGIQVVNWSDLARVLHLCDRTP